MNDIPAGFRECLRGRGKYFINEHCNVWNRETGEICGQYNAHGYPSVNLNWGAKTARPIYIHLLLSEAFPEKIQYYERHLAEPDIFKFIDHKNLIKTDNSFNNLRFADRNLNNQNRAKRLFNHSAEHQSSYKGVYWNKSIRKWHASVDYNYETYWSPWFDTDTEAGHWYDTKVKEIYRRTYGDDVYLFLNFP